MAILKKQLEEREKQLATEQEDASAAKNRLREITKVSNVNLSIGNCDIFYINIYSSTKTL